MTVRPFWRWRTSILEPAKNANSLLYTWTTIYTYAPSTSNRFNLKKRIFFSPVCPTIHTYPVKTVTENASFPDVSQSGDFWKRHQTIVFVWTEENGGFRIRWCHTSYSACPVEHAIVFPWFLRVRVDGRKRFKHATCGNLFFENKSIRIRVDEALHWGQRLVQAILCSFSWNWKLPLPEKKQTLVSWQK